MCRRDKKQAGNVNGGTDHTRIRLEWEMNEEGRVNRGGNCVRGGDGHIDGRLNRWSREKAAIKGDLRAN